MGMSKENDKWRIVDGTVLGQWPMENCGWTCLRDVTNGGLWMGLSKGSDIWSIVVGNV